MYVFGTCFCLTETDNYKIIFAKKKNEQCGVIMLDLGSQVIFFFARRSEASTLLAILLLEKIDMCVERLLPVLTSLSKTCTATVCLSRLAFTLNRNRNISVCAWLTYNPSASVSAHVTVDLQRLALIAPQEDGVRARSAVTIQQNLGAVPGVSVLHTGYTQTHRQRSYVKYLKVTLILPEQLTQSNMVNSRVD